MKVTLTGPGILVLCLCGLSACHPRPPAFSVVPEVPDAPDVSAELMAEHKECFKALKPVTMYSDRGNLVVVQNSIGGVESGKYVIPFISSYDPRLGGDGRFILRAVTGFPEVVKLSGETGTLAAVFDYRRNQSRGR